MLEHTAFEAMIIKVILWEWLTPYISNQERCIEFWKWQRKNFPVTKRLWRFASHPIVVVMSLKSWRNLWVSCHFHVNLSFKLLINSLLFWLLCWPLGIWWGCLCGLPNVRTNASVLSPRQLFLGHDRRGNNFFEWVQNKIYLRWFILNQFFMSCSCSYSCSCIVLICSWRTCRGGAHVWKRWEMCAQHPPRGNMNIVQSCDHLQEGLG